MQASKAKSLASSLDLIYVTLRRIIKYNFILEFFGTPGHLYINRQTDPGLSAGAYKNGRKAILLAKKKNIYNNMLIV